MAEWNDRQLCGPKAVTAVLKEVTTCRSFAVDKHRQVEQPSNYRLLQKAVSPNRTPHSDNKLLALHFSHTPDDERSDDGLCRAALRIESA